jgi:acetyltransferase-like isoleucine patch superfamily enzyme
MALKSLNQLRHLRSVLAGAWRAWLRFRYGVQFGRNVSISLSSRFIARRRNMIAVGDDTLIAFKTLIVSADPRSQSDRPVRIGSRCFVGGGSTIMPGVTIGDECIVGAGAVVFDDVPDRTIVGGNPARILRRDIEVGVYGRLASADKPGARGWAEL